MQSHRVHFTKVAIGFLFLFALAPVYSQEQMKMLEWADHSRRFGARVPVEFTREIEEVELEDILIGNRSIKIGQPFVAEPDWINELSFRVKNISGSEVAHLQITVTLPELKESPEIPFVVRCLGDSSRKCLMPGDEAELKIPDLRLYDWVKEQTARERDLSSISRAAIYVVIVNGRSSGGCLKAADPKNACPPRTR